MRSFDLPAQTNPAAVSVGVLRHLPLDEESSRLEGENDVMAFPLFVTARQAQETLSFRLGYVSAAAVMPEASILSVSLNGREIGQTHVEAFDGVRTIEFPMPAKLARVGFNELKIEARHRHRVDCSLEAVHELWTRIDPARSGLMTPADASAPNSPAELSALSTDAQGLLPIRAVMAARTSPATIERIILASQAIALNGHFERAVVDLGGLAEGEAGLNLALGVAADIASIPEPRKFRRRFRAKARLAHKRRARPSDPCRHRRQRRRRQQGAE